MRKSTLWQIRQAKICLHSLLSEGAWFFGYPQSARRRLWSDYAGASLTWHTCHKVSIRCHSSRQEGYSDFFLISRSKHMVWRIFYLFVCMYTNTCCCYSLEAPHRGASNEYPQHMFSWRNKKKCQSFWLEKNCLNGALIVVSFVLNWRLWTLYFSASIPRSESLKLFYQHPKSGTAFYVQYIMYNLKIIP